MRFLAIFLAAATFAHAATPSLSDQFYNTIRSDDRPGVAKLLGGGANANTRDSRGDTPLMYAAAVGSLDMMRQLIAAGADVNSKNNFESTALMWCANNPEKVRLLLDKGADVNARSKQGRTPLVIAAAHDGNVEVMRLLIKKGADVKAPGPAGATAALIAAASANDAASVRLMIDQGADAKAKAPDGFTALIFAAGNGNAEAVKLLLARGADVNAQSAPSAERPVKNGLIAIGSLTPLLVAVTSGSSETVRLLLKSGADVNAKDVRGMTPLMLAVATDHPNETIIRMLLDKQPATDVKSKANETALEWAAKFQHPSILPAIRKASPGVQLEKLEPVAFQVSKRDPREAVEKSVALLQKATVTFLREGGCVSCHAQNITSVAVSAARAKGLQVDEAAATEVARGARFQFAGFSDGLLERMDPPVPIILIYSLFGLSAEHAEPDRITDAAVHNIAAQQHADGFWDSDLHIQRPPTADSKISTTAFAIRVLRDFAPPARKAEFDNRIAKAATWVKKMEPSTTEDHVAQLLGVKWAGLDSATVDRMAKRVIALQREDGGWAQTPYLKSDAYATGTALYALHESGVAGADAAYSKGVAYLLSTQAEDGSWYVASRAPKFQPYFEGGFPYHHDEWISMWATGYAAAALSHAVRDVRAAN